MCAHNHGVILGSLQQIQLVRTPDCPVLLHRRFVSEQPVHTDGEVGGLDLVAGHIPQFSNHVFVLLNDLHGYVFILLIPFYAHAFILSIRGIRFIHVSSSSDVSRSVWILLQQAFRLAWAAQQARREERVYFPLVAGMVVDHPYIARLCSL